MLKRLLKIFVFSMLLEGERCLAASSIAGYEYIPDAGGWLRLHEIPTTWQEAALRCHLEGGVLASPKSDALTTAMKTMMSANRLAQGSVFTGIHATISKGDFTTIDGVPLSNISLQWADGEPNNVNNNEDCLVMTGAGKAADVSCAIVHPYFCYKDSAKMTVNKCGTTDSEYKLEPRTGSCYKFHRVPRTWHRAAMACAAEGAHLAVINSDTESQVLGELFAKSPPNTMTKIEHSSLAHIGFWNWLEQKDWFTIFGETFAEAGFGEWNEKEPNNNNGIEFCGSVVRNGLLNDVPCDLKIAAICEITPYVGDWLTLRRLQFI